MLTSIIIPAHNGLAHTRACLESVAAHTPEPHEVLLVENGSTDGTADWVAARLPHVQVLRADGPLGFPRACNLGLARARGEQLLLLNNDTLVTPGWLANLTRCLQEAPRAGLVGPLTNRASGLQQIPVPYRDPAEAAAFGAAFNRPDPARWLPVPRLVGFCLLFSRETYRRLGPLDEALSPGTFEDDDYCLRALRRGLRPYLAADTFIHHHGGATFAAAGIDVAAAMARNGRLLAAKHGLRRYDPDPYLHLSGLVPAGAGPVLDAGCGVGAFGCVLRARGAGSVHGLTWDPGAVPLAAALLDQVGVAAPDGCLPPELLPGPYPFIVVTSALDWSPAPAPTLAALSRRLAPGGRLICQFRNAEFAGRDGDPAAPAPGARAHRLAEVLAAGAASGLAYAGGMLLQPAQPGPELAGLAAQQAAAGPRPEPARQLALATRCVVVLQRPEGGSGRE